MCAMGMKTSKITELVIAEEIVICCFLIQWTAIIWQHCPLRESVRWALSLNCVCTLGGFTVYRGVHSLECGKQSWSNFHCRPYSPWRPNNPLNYGAECWFAWWIRGFWSCSPMVTPTHTDRLQLLINDSVEHWHWKITGNFSLSFDFLFPFSHLTRINGRGHLHQIHLNFVAILCVDRNALSVISATGSLTQNHCICPAFSIDHT